jgi:hypothetical protein
MGEDEEGVGERGDTKREQERARACSAKWSGHVEGLPKRKDKARHAQDLAITRLGEHHLASVVCHDSKAKTTKKLSYPGVGYCRQIALCSTDFKFATRLKVIRVLFYMLMTFKHWFVRATKNRWKPRSNLVKICQTSQTLVNF